MASRRAITGGTGDVNPQYFLLNCTQTAADTTTTQATSIPVQRLPQGRGAQVMEVLKVILNPVELVTEGADNTTSWTVTTRNLGTTGVNENDSSLVAFFKQVYKFTTSGKIVYNWPLVLDLTDGAGHGLLIATDNLYFQIESTGTSQVQNATIRLLYRWKNVGLAEYVGIVQSQTNS